MTIAGQFGCGRCFQADAESAYKAFPGFKEVARLIDESHYIIRIAACPNCGQRCVSVFTELIDWEDGDDSQCWTVLPVTEQEATELATQGEGMDVAHIQALGEGRRSLRRISPSGQSPGVAWVTGKVVILPHD